MSTASSGPPRSTFVVRRLVALGLLALVVIGLVMAVTAVVGLVTPGPPTVMASAEKVAPPTPLPPGSPRTCEADEVALAITPGADTYTAPDRPTFTVTITGTARQPCLVDAADGSRAVTITQDGERVWSSADCSTGRRLLLVADGDVDSRQVTWDRTRSEPGCKGKARTAKAGEYQAAVTVDGVADLTSAPATFTLVAAPRATKEPEATAEPTTTAKSTKTAEPTKTAKPTGNASAEPSKTDEPTNEPSGSATDEP